MHLQILYSTIDYVEQNCHFRLQQFITSTHIMEQKLKILGTNKESAKIISFYLVFRAFDHFYCDVVKRKRPCLFGVY